MRWCETLFDPVVGRVSAVVGSCAPKPGAASDMCPGQDLPKQRKFLLG